MSGKRVIAIVISIILDILTLIIGASVIFVSVFSGNLIGAGIAFIVVLGLMIAFPLLGVLITRERTVKIDDKRRNYKQENSILNLKEIKKIASKYKYGMLLGKTARAIIMQADIIGKKIYEAKRAVDNRFASGSITWDRYMGVVESAADTALNNLDMMARRISVLDEREYARLSNPLRSITHKEDVSGRLEFYQENKQLIDKGISENEMMFNKLDKLTLELGRDDDSSARTDAVIDDIEEITGQVKYYN